MSTPARILIVDDDPDIIEQLSALLKHEGYQVAACESCAAAEQTLMAFQPDLAVLDLMMEQHDSGFVLCREVKRLYPETPVILLTSVKAATGLSFSPVSPDAQNWVKADRLLDKPIRPEQLRNEIRRLLSAAAIEAHV